MAIFQKIYALQLFCFSKGDGCKCLTIDFEASNVSLLFITLALVILVCNFTIEFQLCFDKCLSLSLWNKNVINESF